MTANQNYFIHLISAFFNDTVPDYREDIDLKEVLDIAKIHNVQGIIAHIIKKHHAVLKPDDSIINICDEALYSTIIHSTTKKYSFENLMKSFDKEKIPRVLMKGIVVRDYYPVADLRTFGDIDFLIKKEDRERSHELMQRLGYRLKSSWGDVWGYQRETEYYEIHTHILHEVSGKNKSIPKYFGSAWEHVENKSEYSYRFMPEYHLIYLLLHLAKHLWSSGAGVRMFLDIAFLIRFEKLDWEYIWSELEKIKFADFTDCVLALCNRWFQCQANTRREVPDSTLDEMELFAIKSGIFGFEERSPETEPVRRHLKKSSSLKKAKILAAIEFLFPPYYKMLTAYPAIKAFPPLLPFVWIYRAFKGIALKRKNAKRKFNVIFDKFGDTVEHNSLLNKIGINNQFE